MSKSKLITRNLSSAWQSIKNGQPIQEEEIFSGDVKRPSLNYPQVSIAHTGSGLVKNASSGGIIYGQPMFFSPVHTPINWQIPSKRKEIYQWQVVDGELLTEDFSYEKISCFDVSGEEIVDSVTGGVMLENPVCPAIMSGIGTFYIPSKWGERHCTDKASYKFKLYGYYHEFSVSEEHNIYVLDGYWWRKKKKIESNSAYRKAKGIEPNGVVKVNIPDKKIIRKEAKNVSIKDFLLTPVVEFENRASTNLEMAYLVGLCSADGCIKSNNHVHITSSKHDIHINTIESIIERAFNKKVLCETNEHDSCENAVRTNLTGNNVGAFFSKYIVGKHTYKKFTKEAFSLSKEEILHLLGGYLDGDGSYNQEEGKIIANNYSKDMADQIWWMLIKCGIRASLNKYPLYGEHYPTDSVWCYRIFIPSSDVPKIAPYMLSGKVPSDFKPKKERELKFFYEEDGITYFCQPISEITQFLHSGSGYDMQMDPDRSYVISGCKVSNCRFYYENEPKVASAIDFYSLFPVNGFTIESKNRYIKHFYEKIVRELNLQKWLRVISHETYLLGDCFPFVEIACDKCNGTGSTPDGYKCDHEKGSFKRIVVLNPEYVEIYTNPIAPEPVITLIPDEELRSLVMKKMPGHERLSRQIVQHIVSGMPIPLDNANVSHIKFGESGYNRYGTSLIRRLFQTLAYKTKLMTAQWIIAERLILPIKIVRVGTEERPAGPQDLSNIQEQLAQTANDPNLTLITHHAIEFDWFGAAGKVLQLSNEFDLISQEVLDGLMINKALLNGEGPTYSNAAIGIEAMIDRLEAWRSDLKHWVEQKIFLPIAKMHNFTQVNEWGEEEVLYPKLKWNIMHLRDQQQYRQFIMQLFDKGIVSKRRILETFDIDPDEEEELTRYERSINATMPQLGGAAGGMGGGFGGGGGLDLGGGAPPLPGGAPAGGEMPGGAPGAAPGGATGGAPAGGPPLAKQDTVADISSFDGKILKQKTRDKILREKQKLNKQVEKSHGGKDGQLENSGIIGFTEPERNLLKELIKSKNIGDIKYAIVPQYKVKAYGSQLTIDFALPQIKLGVEVDGTIWHSDPSQIQRDKERDNRLVQEGWTILRFTDSEIESRLRQVVETIISYITKKEEYLKKLTKSDK